MAQAKRAEDNKQTQQDQRSQTGTSSDRRTQERPSQALARDRDQQRGLAGPRQFTSPFSFMRRFSEEMDRLFDDFAFGGGLSRPGFTRGSFGPSFGREFEQLSAWVPQTEVFERGNQFIVRADLPGLTRDDVTVDIDEDHIILRGDRREEHETTERGIYQSERSYGSFYRAIPLPDGVEGEKAYATFNNGVLEITMPITERRPKGRRLEIGEGAQQATQTKSKAAGR